MVGLADFTIVSAGVWVAGTVADDGGDSAAPPLAMVPVATAVLVTEPASMSACVTVYVAVQSDAAPGASGPAGQVAIGGVPVPENAVSSMVDRAEA